MSALLRSLRHLILGETWTIPLGVWATLVLALLLRAALPTGAWQAVGGFTVAALLVVALACSLRTRW
jgi:hypothetical protein